MSEDNPRAAKIAEAARARRTPPPVTAGKNPPPVDEATIDAAIAATEEPTTIVPEEPEKVNTSEIAKAPMTIISDGDLSLDEVLNGLGISGSTTGEQPEAKEEPEQEPEQEPETKEEPEEKEEEKPSKKAKKSKEEKTRAQLRTEAEQARGRQALKDSKLRG